MSQRRPSGGGAGIVQQVHQQSNLTIDVLLELMDSLIDIVRKSPFHQLHIFRKNLFQVGAKRLLTHSKNKFKNNNVTVTSNIVTKTAKLYNKRPIHSFMFYI